MNRNHFPWWAITGVVLLSVITIGTRLSIVNTTYSINQIDKTIQITKRERETEKLKLHQLKSPRRLETLAKNKFKLQTPAPQQWIHLR